MTQRRCVAPKANIVCLVLVLSMSLWVCRHDFVVVETIDFYDDEDAELGPPVTQRDVLLLERTLCVWHLG